MSFEIILTGFWVRAIHVYLLSMPKMCLYIWSLCSIKAKLSVSLWLSQFHHLLVLFLIITLYSISLTVLFLLIVDLFHISSFYNFFKLVKYALWLLLSQRHCCFSPGALSVTGPPPAVLLPWRCIVRVEEQSASQLMTQVLYKRSFMLSPWKTMWLNFSFFTLYFDAGVGVAEFISKGISI